MSSRYDQRLGDVGRYWLTFAVCLGLLMFRGWDRLAHAELFAEGMVFVGDALNGGWLSVFTTKDQFWHVAPRFIATLVVKVVPVADIPLFTNLACYATTAAVAASVVRPCYRWIIRDDAARVVLALLLTFAPGLIEILGNLAGMHWSLLLWMGLLTLKDPKYPLTAWELTLAAVTLLTSAGAVVFMPVVFLRVLLARGRHSIAPYRPALAVPRFAGEVMLLTAFVLVTLLLASHFLTQDVREISPGVDLGGRWRGLDVLLPRLGALFATFYVVHPFLGTEHTTLFVASVPYYLLIVASIALVAVLLVRISREMNYRFWLIPTWIIALMLLGVMLSIVRYWAFYGVFSFPHPNWWTRYHFIFGSTGLILWFILLRPQDLRRITHWSVVVLFVLTIAYVSQADTRTRHALHPHKDDGYAVNRYGDTRYWSRAVGDLERSMKTGCPHSVRVVSYPGGKWRFIYESPLPVPEGCSPDGTGEEGR